MMNYIYQESSTETAMSNRLKLVLYVILLMSITSGLWAQRERLVHDRGTLHETFYNTGVFVAPYKNNGIESTNTPMTEWPAWSRTVIDNIEYYGQHNGLGGGIHIGVNHPGKLGVDQKHFSFAGMVGSGGPEMEYEVWCWPLEFWKETNYPLLEDGSLNPDFDPNEAEQLIHTRFATSVGMTVTRVTRQYSYPMLDDIIFHEYELEFTGNTDYDENTIEQDSVDTYVDALFAFHTAIPPNMMSFQRTFGSWYWKPGIFRGDVYNSFDTDYTMFYCQSISTQQDHSKPYHPEPDEDLFWEFSSTGLNGGGLLAPQAAGHTALHWDREHLTVLDTNDTTFHLTTMEYAQHAADFEWDENLTIKQPWGIIQNAGWFVSTSLINKPHYKTHSRAQGKFPELDAPDPNEHPMFWVGRPKYKPKSAEAPASSFVCGPYTINRGDILHFSFAQVVGYGSDPGKRVFGGGQKSDLWGVAPDINAELTVGDSTFRYLDTFGYPDYVNAETGVISVQDVAREAWKAYTGWDIEHDSLWAEDSVVCWPDWTEPDGVYDVYVPVPAPGLKVSNDEDANIHITWSRAVEDFTHSSAALDSFYIWRSFNRLGPWKRLVAISAGEVNSENIYEYIDDDIDFAFSDVAFYSVTTRDVNGFQSGKTNMTQHRRDIGPEGDLENIFIVPNPFILESGFQNVSLANAVSIFGLPEKCSIRVYSFAGQKVQSIEHENSESGSLTFNLVNENNMLLAPGVYFVAIQTPDGQQTMTKFVIIR
ncbi:MAG: T9SS type A sorting domain-containing protein [Candidatus Marinimicrobia bacterium]|jgi:hypothetical protein|nr:T9SS type A sorting domain-containing protein [Candidatus Neomarinimicrobiota bacterium]MBT3823612.1 T9SS type A sorting domain-containing protein [Candidatus Neomarinimicrobiota bacterium]MBT4129529.1 T9SS type A sorting domain-containing protein [Candidatus Neomarinimicrobiota bacterium]MBT4295945.1 T9SS type A sorting domain-containing protein [Candidatus Neomarinimicrobiota bacterium]MBT4420053.1 T9SS type A sorting domain-containing protein [Candidatus Neomarinimicrobiota bacterium]